MTRAQGKHREFSLNQSMATLVVAESERNKEWVALESQTSGDSLGSPTLNFKFSQLDTFFSKIDISVPFDLTTLWVCDH